jgi:hypothetical protein
MRKRGGNDAAGHRQKQPVSTKPASVIPNAGVGAADGKAAGDVAPLRHPRPPAGAPTVP